MGKIVSNFFISLDGVVESPDKWHFPYFDEEMGEAVSAGFATTDAMLMGRVLYDEWAAFWPENADQPFGDVINSMKKFDLILRTRGLLGWVVLSFTNGRCGRRGWRPSG